MNEHERREVEIETQIKTELRANKRLTMICLDLLSYFNQRKADFLPTKELTAYLSSKKDYLEANHGQPITPHRLALWLVPGRVLSTRFYVRAGGKKRKGPMGYWKADVMRAASKAAPVAMHCHEILKQLKELEVYQQAEISGLRDHIGHIRRLVESD